MQVLAAEEGGSKTKRSPKKSMASSCEQCCDSCGLPPRCSTDQTPIPLKRCSRCQRAWYHDVECQRRHYVRQHRKVCGKSTDTDTTTIRSSRVGAQGVTFRIEKRSERGRCVVACCSIVVGQVISSFSPLIPPVLNEANRSTRCALCFGLLDHVSVKKYDNNVEKYPLFLCSSRCYQQGLPWLEEEERLVADLCGKGRGIRILPTAIFLYRVLRNIAAQESTENKSDCSLRAKVDDLEAHETELSDDERNHMGAVIAVARRLVHGRAQLVNEREQKLLLSFSTDYMIMMVSRMKTNGFSICDGENVAIGVGLFDVASNMNHSCRPNALQTFSYARQGALPTIRITACTAISSRDEICISYIDNGCPRDMRRKRLQEGYHFWCTCSACRDDNHDDRIVGVCCPKARCHGIGKRLSHLDSRPSEWVCDKCGNSDFCKATELMRSLHDNYRSKMSIEEQENLYAEFRSGFSASSWYVCESGEQLAQSLLDATNGGSDHETRRLCARALAVLDQLLAASNSAFENDAWKVLRNRVILYKAAKLRLFLYPDPRVALTELRRTLEVLCIYYPKDHEFLLGLENTMSQAMY